jgi:glycosyltransferase involved in cell wall biosynthesis
MNALIVTPFYPPHVGGIQRYSAGVASELRARGWDVDVVQGLLAPYVAGLKKGPAGERLYSVPSRNLLGRLAVPIPCRATLAVLRHVSASRYDLVIVQSHLFLANVLVAVAARRSRQRMVWINHGSGHIPSGRWVLDRIISAYEHLLAGVLGRIARTVVAVSDEAMLWASHLGFPAAGNIGNGVSSDQIHPPRGSREDGAPLRVVFAGRLEESKGAMDAVRIVGGLTGVSLVICGDGTQAEAVRESASRFADQVKLTGAITAEQVHGHLANADVLLLPSTYPEGFPTVFLEAGSAGAAIVTYPVGAATQICSTGGGWIVRSPTGARALLSELASDPMRAQRAGEALRVLVAEKFTWPLVVDRILDLARTS